MNIEDYFCCPYCSGDLSPDDNGYMCSICSARFDNQDGIACLITEGINTENSYIPNPEDLNRKTKELGWKTGVIEHIRDYLFGRDYADIAKRQFISESPADFQYLLPINHESIVLVLGVGWGNITSSLARNAKFVFAVDVNLPALKFVRFRSQEEDLNNINFIQSATSSFSAKENRFDVIVLAGTLDRLIYERNDHSPLQILSKSLIKVFTALKPEGEFFISAENRYNISYFLGKKEPYTNLRFVPLLPDRVAEFYTKTLNRKEYRRAFYSKYEIHRLILDNGFKNESFIYPIPGYRNPRFFSKLENRKILQYLLKILSGYPRFSQIYFPAGILLHLLPLAIIKFFWPNYCVIAKRP